MENKEQNLRILILEDNPTDAELMVRELRRVNIRFISNRVETKEAFARELKHFNPDLILSDYSLPQFDGLAALRLVQEQAPSIPVIMVTGSINEDTAVECIKAGATDYGLRSICSAWVLPLRAPWKRNTQLRRKHRR